MSLLPTSVPANFSTMAIHEDQNDMSATQLPDEELTEWYSNILPVYILCIAVLGIILNVFVLVVFCLHKKSCTVAEIYLSNLAAADLVLMIFLPFWAVYAANNFDWPFGNHLCRLVTVAINMNAYSSIYFIVLISIDRYMALVHPLSHEGIRRPKYAKLLCVLVWGFGLVLSIPTLVYRRVLYNNYYNISQCSHEQTLNEQLLFDGLLTTFGFIIPIIIIFCCTLKIIQALNNRFLGMLDTQMTEQKATTLIVVVLLAFMICWVPFHVVKILNMLLIANVLTAPSFRTNLLVCMQVFMYFAFFNSVLNPILYMIVGKNFQGKVRELFKQWRHTRTSTLNSTNTNPSMRSFSS
ncbi:B2 bradykinin receptor-like [Cottoperca gobio]|uniref:B2 bradykinin receptor-like n=1 Tax=Cottoperca gobio TaxID=56716 RepID=A0A6J2S4G6_COTGO|nr:B2 bradykinin receptor-like [Cottoperca gobio]